MTTETNRSRADDFTLARRNVRLELIEAAKDGNDRRVQAIANLLQTLNDAESILAAFAKDE